ncbi:hypothetical protein [Entomobacter blattae]|nr:hypothetical protein [Entomobacter blattae]
MTPLPLPLKIHASPTDVLNITGQTDGLDSVRTVIGKPVLNRKRRH